jgi:hypothetical protein
MNLWENVVTTALLGTERQPLALPPLGDSLGNVLSRLNVADRERSLLGAAAAISLHQRAGRLPTTDNQPPLPPCETDDLPRCNPRSEQHLSLMLSGQHKEVLPEWLAAAATVSKRVPENCLPALLDLGQKQHDLRDAILPALGKRGRWLAAQNDDWSWAVGGDEDDETIWQTGSREARRLFLQRLRATSPNRARELVLSTWAEDTPEDRAAFLQTFQTGLSMADEPFLEECLDDRRKEVRSVAVDLLSRLPESRLCQRMIERVRPLLKLKTGKKPQVEVTLPKECDKAMERDGIEPKPPSGTGQKAWWMKQIISVVPPFMWCQTWSKTPTELAQIVANNKEWKLTLFEWWALAAQRHRDIQWAEGLLAYWSAPGGTPFKSSWCGAVLEVLSTDQQECFFLNLLQSKREPLNDIHILLLRKCRHNWSAKFSRTVLDCLRLSVAKAKRYDYHLREMLKESARCIPPALVNEAAQGWDTKSKEWDDWREAVGEFLAILQFRHDMLKEFDTAD